MKKLINGIEIELTEQEIIEREQRQLISRTKKDEEDNIIKQKEINKQSALNKLKALGLNDAEINSILGK
jgi:hypothetical protein